MLNIAHQFAVDGDAFEYDSIDCQLQINFCLASLTRATSRWALLLQRCKFWGWVGLGPVLSALYAFCPGVCCLCCCVELASVRLGTKATLSAHILGLRYVSQFEQIFCATLIIK